MPCSRQRPMVRSPDNPKPFETGRSDRRSGQHKGNVSRENTGIEQGSKKNPRDEMRDEGNCPRFSEQ